MKNEGLPSVDKGIITLSGEIGKDMKEILFLKAFVEFCESVHVTQGMSKSGFPYDNVAMERYFNTLKNEYVNLYEFHMEEVLYQAVEEFAYVAYNHVCPHSYHGYRAPYQVRTAS